MNYMRCSICGGKLLPNKNERTILVCENCNNQVDLNQYLKVTVDIDKSSMDEKEKERLIKNAYLHIDNKKFDYAGKIVETLEFEYPGDSSIINLRNYYDISLKAFKDEQNHLTYIYNLESQINAMVQNKNFWHPTNNDLNHYELEKAISLLDEAEKNNIDCIGFRANMWGIFNDIRNGRLKLNETKTDNLHKLHKMFYNAEAIYNLEKELAETKFELQQTQKQWGNYITRELAKAFIIGLSLIISSILLYINRTNLTWIEIQPEYCMLIGTVGIIVLSFMLLYILIYNSNSNLLKRLLINTKIQEKNEREIETDIHEIEDELEKALVEFSDTELKFQEITFDKAIKYMHDNKELLKSTKGA